MPADEAEIVAARVLERLSSGIEERWWGGLVELAVCGDAAEPGSQRESNGLFSQVQRMILSILSATPTRETRAHSWIVLCWREILMQ